MSKWSATPWGLQSVLKPKDIAPAPPRKTKSKTKTKTTNNLDPSSPSSSSSSSSSSQYPSQSPSPDSSLSSKTSKISSKSKISPMTKSTGGTAKKSSSSAPSYSPMPLPMPLPMASQQRATSSLVTPQSQSQSQSHGPSPDMGNYADADTMMVNKSSRGVNYPPQSQGSLSNDSEGDMIDEMPQDAPKLQQNKSLENYDGIPREYDNIQLLPESSSSSSSKNKKKKASTPSHLKAIELLNSDELGKIPIKDQLRGLQRELSEVAFENQHLANTGLDQGHFRDIPRSLTRMQQQQQHSDSFQIPFDEPFYFDNDDVSSFLLPPPPPALVSDSSSSKSSSPQVVSPNKNSYSQKLGISNNSKKKSGDLPTQQSPAANATSYSQQLQRGATGGQRVYLEKNTLNQGNSIIEQQENEEDRVLEAKFAELIIDKSRIDKIAMIGEGYFGEVWRGLWDSSLSVALKCLKHGVKNTVDKSKFFSEVSSLAKMRHPNITVFYGATPPPEAYIISELLQCSLFQLIYSHKHLASIPPSSSTKPPKPFPLKVILRILSDVSYGGNYLHNMKPNPVMHRDLTSSNVLLTVPHNISEEELLIACADASKPIAKLTDFGLSREVDWCMTACVGNLFYLAPEVYTGEHYSQSADIYSFGILMWELVSRESPHGGVNPQRVAFLAATQNLRPPFSDNRVTSEPFRALNRRCWHADPQERPSFRDVALQLQIFRNAQLPTPASAPKFSSPAEESTVAYHTFSGDVNLQPGPKIARHEPRDAPDQWQQTRHRLNAFLLNRPSLSQLSRMGEQGYIKPWYLREYQEDAARSLPPGDKNNPMHQLLESLPEVERPKAIRDMLLKRSQSDEFTTKR